MLLADIEIARGWQAELALDFERRQTRTVLAGRRQNGPLVVQKALYPEGDAVCHAIVLHPPAGIAGGDQLRIEARARAGAHALLTTPGAGKWYRSAGPCGGGGGVGARAAWGREEKDGAWWGGLCLFCLVASAGNPSSSTVHWRIC